MAEKFIPTDVPENNWKKLEPNKAYAFRSDEKQDIHLRFGAGGLYLSIMADKSGNRIINSVSIAEGNLTVMGTIKPKQELVMGRVSDAGLHVTHAIVSRKHLHFYQDANVLIIKDLGSTNGTYFHTENFQFDIESYLSRHPSSDAATSTMDEVHEAFGPAIDDFLKSYSEKFKKG